MGLGVGLGLGLGLASLDEHELLHRVGLGVRRTEEVGREHEREVAHLVRVRIEG